MQLALLGLEVELGENGDFDGACRGHHFIGVEEIFLSGGEIEDGYAEDAIHVGVNFGDGGLQLLPEDLLFFLGGLLCA